MRSWLLASGSSWLLGHNLSVHLLLCVQSLISWSSSVLLDVIDNYFKTAVCTNELNEQFHSNTEERRFFVCSAVLFLLDSTGPRPVLSAMMTMYYLGVAALRGS